MDPPPPPAMSAVPRLALVQALGMGQQKSTSAPVRATRRGPPPCSRCGTNVNVVPFFTTGVWFCGAPACHMRWSSERPTSWSCRRAFEQWAGNMGEQAQHQKLDKETKHRMKKGNKCGNHYIPLRIEVHFDQLGLACTSCQAFYPWDEMFLAIPSPHREEEEEDTSN